MKLQPAPTSLTAPAIEIAGVSKRFKLFKSQAHRFRDMVLCQNSHRDYWALRDVNLSVMCGETIGLIGVNGAGKSTLLRLIATTMTATSGTVRVGGRVSALLELGAGFHPEWTGRQNAEFYIRLMRVPRSAAKTCMREIEAFADVGEYFDQPLRTYSSGMFLRVAFAAAANIEPDILIVDEALAVGDAQFQHKCFQRIAELKSRGVTILFVTHRLELISQLCSRAIVLHGGKIAFDGKPGEAINRYIDLLFSGGTPDRFGAPPHLGEDTPISGSSSPEYRMGSGEARILDVVALREGDARAKAFSSGEMASFIVRVQFEADVERPVFGFSLKTVEEVCVYSTNNEMKRTPLRPVKKGDILKLRVDCPMSLPTGTVFADFSISSIGGNGVKILDARMSMLKLSITGWSSFFGIADLHATVSEVARESNTMT